MEISVAEQAAAFTGAVCLGFIVGVLYDFLRLIRHRLSLLGGALDFLFWIVVTVSLFLFAADATGGEVRIFVLLSVFGGAVAYFLTLSAWVLGLGALIAEGIALLGRFIKLPVQIVWICSKKIKENLKNLFLYRRKWFKIKAAFEAMDDAARFEANRDEKGECHASDQSKFAD